VLNIRILDMGHIYGTIEEMMEIMQVKENCLLTTLERFHIYDLSADVHNPIFDLIINNPN
jgi:hypothetical protein